MSHFKQSLLIGALLLCWNLACGLHPVVLVPGDGGNQIEAKLDKPSVVHYICDKKTSDYFNLWLNLELLVPVVIDCWVDNIRLVYNTTTRKTENSPGVEIRVPGFGNSTVVEYIDPSKASQGLYFNAIVEQSLFPHGYSRNNSVFGAPYDFRKAPNEMDEWMQDFKKLIEYAYDVNNSTSVVMLAHSMGGPLSLYFLNQMTSSWKDKYVKSLICLGCVWGGAVKALKVFAVGDDLGAYLLPAHTLRGEQRNSPSTAWLLPSKGFWNDDEVLVEVPGRGNFTVNDYEDFFNAMDFRVGYEMRKDTENLLPLKLPHPGVEVHCLYGTKVDTVEKLVYKDVSYFPDKPNLTYGDGDGTVNIRSLKGCQDWISGGERDSWTHRRKQKLRYMRLYKKYLAEGAKIEDFDTFRTLLERRFGPKKAPRVYIKEFGGVDHIQILRDAGVTTYIKNVIGQMNFFDPK